MPLGLLDLSVITDHLVNLLNGCRGDPSEFTATGMPPDEIRNESECQLSLYLFHVSPDKYQRNSPVSGPWADPAKTKTRVPPIPYQPLSLNLYYVLTAYYKGKGAYVKEQQAMSTALKCFYEEPIVKFPLGGGDQGEFCLTMEVESADEIGRLWQAITSSLRLSVVYKASVIFIEPPTPPTLAKPPDTINLAISPASLPFATAGQVICTYIRVDYVGPNATPLQPDPRSFELVPAVVAPGIPARRFHLYGAGLNQSISDHLYLVFPNSTEQEVTAWMVANPAPPAAPVQTAAKLTLDLPTTGIPPAGVYQLRVGNGEPIGHVDALRSNATPFSIAAWVDPAGGPLLSPSGGVYTLNGIGFVPGALEVLLETVPLSQESAVGPGQFDVNGAGTAIRFQLPSSLPEGRYGVRVRVNGVESSPVKWVVKEP
jgi:hypothetical protein